VKGRGEKVKERVEREGFRKEGRVLGEVE